MLFFFLLRQNLALVSQAGVQRHDFGSEFSGDPSTSVPQAAENTSVPPNSANFCIFVGVEVRFHHIAQAGLELKKSIHLGS